MLGLFRFFGRSAELVALDQGLRGVGLHPRAVPEAVKLTAVRILKHVAPGGRISDAACEDAAQLLGFCMLGRNQFIASNSIRAADEAERRLEMAIDAGDSLDSKLVLLAVHADVMVADLAERFDVETG